MTAAVSCVAIPVDSPLNHSLFAGVTNVLALANLYKEPIDGYAFDHVLQEITHKDMCHGGSRSHSNALWFTFACGLISL